MSGAGSSADLHDDRSVQEDFKDRQAAFLPEEDELLVVQACVYEDDIRHRGKSAKVEFWQAIRQVFANAGFSPRGPEILTREEQSPYRKRWSHIRTSYSKVKQYLADRAAIMPQNQSELNTLLAESLEACKKEGRIGGLSLGFRHFGAIFTRLYELPEHGEGSNGAEVLLSIRNENGRPSISTDLTTSREEGATGSTSLKRPLESDSIDRLTRRTRQAQSNAVRMANVLRDVNARAETIVEVLRETNPAFTDSLAYKADIFVRLVAEERQATSEERRDQLRLIANLVFSELQPTPPS